MTLYRSKQNLNTAAPFAPLPRWEWFWQDAAASLPLHDIGNAAPETFDLAARTLRSVPFGTNGWTQSVGPRGYQISCSGAGESQVDIPNFIQGSSEFTALAVMTPSTVVADMTILGSWDNGNDVIILHFDSNSKIRFLLGAPGIVGSWTADTYTAGVEQRLVIRLQTDGTMDVFMNGSKNTVRTGASLTVNTNSDVLGFLGSTAVGDTSNDSFRGDAAMLHCLSRAISDAQALQWTADPFGGFMADDFPLHLWKAAGAPGGANPKNPLGLPLYGPFGGPIGV